MQKRRSIRRFLPTAIPAETLTKILEAANRAPSAGNLQAYHVLVVQDAALKQRLAAACANQRSIVEAPVVLVFCTQPDRSAAQFGRAGEELLCVQDATIACAYAQLAATALGLGSLWIGARLESETLQDTLTLGEGLWPIALLPLGHPAEQPLDTPRRTLNEMARAVPS